MVVCAIYLASCHYLLYIAYIQYIVLHIQLCSVLTRPSHPPIYIIVYAHTHSLSLSHTHTHTLSHTQHSSIAPCGMEGAVRNGWVASNGLQQPPLRYSVYLLYWYKSTNTDAEGACSQRLWLWHVALGRFERWEISSRSRLARLVRTSLWAARVVGVSLCVRVVMLDNIWSLVCGNVTSLWCNQRGRERARERERACARAGERERERREGQSGAIDLSTTIRIRNTTL